MRRDLNKGKVVLFYPSYEGMGKYHWFPFPYLYIGPFLEKAGFKAIIIDARVEPDWKNKLAKAAKDALCLGITAMTGSDIRDALEAIRICKGMNPEVLAIWGGPHATALPAETLQSACVDIVALGQGEYVMPEIAGRIYSNKDYTDISGIAYKRNQTIYQNTKADPRPFDYDLFPGFHLINIEKYRSPNNVASVFTARGCPFRCTFCTAPDNNYSEKKFEQVKNEILFIVNKLGFKNIFIQDGTYFIKKERVMDIARFFITSGLNIKWKAKARVSSLLDYSKEEMILLKESGLASLFFGVESGSEHVLERMRKHTKPEQAERCAQICHEFGIEFYASFMFATPSETINDLKDTINHIRRLKKINPGSVIQNCIYLPLPSTPMYKEACANGYTSPNSLEGWTGRSISSRFEERDDITWIPSNILSEYIKTYNEEFGVYKHLFERELEGSYKPVFDNMTCISRSEENK
ncbi:MAG: B12-binding domain-containing radical SAM protein [Candidatus Omnitrophica bacterium]|nr:B12-binding domain-containing radical SAM protein [Candidatus Omnitrophota bacterium]